MIVTQNDKLPESIAKILEGRASLRCRIAWRIIATDRQGHGDWHELGSEAFLQREVEAANSRHEGRITHWLEYE